MWINLDDKQAELLKQAATTWADDERRDIDIFKMTDPELGARLEDEANTFRAIAEKIEQMQLEAASDDPYRNAAQERADDELEIDSDAIVSAGSDPGAWVHAWIWITNDEAGIPDEDDDEGETCRTCGETYAAGGDGFDGECPDCADKTDQKLNPENYE